VAARAGDAETVEELLAAGADPLCTDQQGRTALQLAAGEAARKMLAAAARAAPKAES
jgi:ankyrin repeat protein